MDTLLFGAFPYVAIVIFVVGTIFRYKTGFKYSSLSSQLLEGKKLFSASVPFHVGIIVVFLGHLIGFLFPSVFTSMGGSTLVMLETAGLAFAAAGGSFLTISSEVQPITRALTNVDIASNLYCILPP